MTGWHVLRYDAYRLMPWKNGAGMTREIHRFPPADGDFHWRLSMADVTQPGAFSRYPGYQRLLSVLRGGGMALRIDAAPAVTLGLFGTLAFSGDSRVDSALLAGPFLDFNLIYRPDLWQATLCWQRAETASVATDPAVTTLIFSAAATLTIHPADGEPCSLQRYDCAMLPPGAATAIAIQSDGPWAMLTLRPHEHH